jgi:hypothetical protein
MKTVTIRGVEPEVAETLKASAKRQGKSINQMTLDILKSGLGLKKKKKYTTEYDDLDDLFGRWSEDEYQAIQGKIGDERRIDPELWT